MRVNWTLAVLSAFSALILISGPLRAEEQVKEPPAQLGGPDQVDNQLDEDAFPKQPFFDFTFLGPYFEFKDSLKARSGLGFGADYSAVYLGATESLGSKSASSGMFRFFGSWELVGRGTANTGALVFKLEHRHRYGSVAPSAFGFEVGYIGLLEPPFSNAEFLLGNLYWRQSLFGGNAVLLGGWLDATDYIDVYALASPWLHFMNFTFSVGSASIPVPNQGLGAAGGLWLGQHVYVLGGLADSNSDPTEPGDSFDSFFDQAEYFKHLEVGLVSARNRAYFDNVHVTYWHADEREAATTPSGWGLNASATKYINDQILPFVRGGYAKDGGSLLESSLSAGVGYQPVAGSHLLGFAGNWGKPNENSFGSGLRDQYALELFLRIQLSRQLAITPDVQLLLNPARNPDQSSIWVFGLRGRLAL